MPTSPFTDARKAFTPMNYTPMMEQVGKEWKLWPLNWPPSNEFPGEPERFDKCEQPPTPLGFLNIVLEKSIDFLDGHKGEHLILTTLYKDLASHLSEAVGLCPSFHLTRSRRAITPCYIASRPLRSCFRRTSPSTNATSISNREVDQMVQRESLELLYGLIEQDDSLRRLFIILDTALATLVGMIEDNVLQDGFMAIEGYDMSSG